MVKPHFIFIFTFFIDIIEIFHKIVHNRFGYAGVENRNIQIIWWW